MNQTEIIAWTEEAGRLIAKRRTGYVHLTAKQRQRIAELKAARPAPRRFVERACESVRSVMHAAKSSGWTVWAWIVAHWWFQTPPA